MSKARTTGKIIAVILCCAIVFFLLLPFLDSPQGTSAQNGQKAVPQLFTSNPLTDLVNKIYALVRGGKKRTGSQRYASGTGTDGLGELLPAEWTADARLSSQNAKSPSSTSSPATYDYADAGMLNEEGEWVLVRQTAPDAAQRGMHDIKATDTPYDRLVRQERAAKFTGPATADGKSPKEIPVSKWARLWTPVKNFFTGEEESLPGTNTPERAMLASASSGLNGTRGGSSSSGRARPGLNMNIGPFRFSDASATDQTNAPGLFAMFNPEFMLQGVVDNLKKMAAKDMNPKQQGQFNKEIDEYKNSKYAEMRQKFLDKIAQDAGDQEAEDVISFMNGCGSGTKGLYSMGSASCKEMPLSPEELQEEAQRQTAEAKEAQARSLNILSELAGLPLNPKDMNMTVLSGMVKNAPDVSRQSLEFLVDPEEYKNIQRQDQTLAGFYEYMIETQGCKDNPCYWVGADRQTDPTMQNIINSSGMNYEGDPLHLMEGLIAGYQKKQMDEAKTDEQREAAGKISEDLQDYSPQTVVYNGKNMAGLNQRNDFDPDNPRKPKNPLTAYSPTAAIAQKLVQQGAWEHPGVLIYGGDILKEKEENISVPERGENLRNLIVRQAQNAIEMAELSSEDIARFGMGRLLRHSRPQDGKAPGKGNFSKSSERAMGL